MDADNQQVFRLNCGPREPIEYKDLHQYPNKFDSWWAPAHAWLDHRCGPPSRVWDPSSRWGFVKNWATATLFLTIRDRDLFLLIFDDWGIPYEPVSTVMVNRIIKQQVSLLTVKPL